MLKATVAAFVCAMVIGWTLGMETQAWSSMAVAEQLSRTAEKPKEKDKEKSSAKLMRKKLAAVQDVIEGLTTEDYEMIAQGAKLLKTLAGEADFQLSKDMIYVQHTAEFTGLAEKLEKAAQDRNLDKASLHYVDLTMNCIECHRFVRDVLIAKK